MPLIIVGCSVALTMMLSVIARELSEIAKAIRELKESRNAE